MGEVHKLETEKEPRKTVLIFGISSFVGSNLAAFLKKDYKVVGTYKETPVRMKGVLTLPCDVLNKDEVQLVLYSFKPDFVIYAVGMSSIYECHKNPELAEALNSSGLINVAEYCQRYKAQICYISSNFVFAGEDKKYMEMDIPDSITTYGKTQAQAEFYLQKTSLNYIIFRCCRLYGRSYHPLRENYFEVLQRKIFSREPLTVDGLITNGYLDIYYLGIIIKLAYDKQVTNRLLQVSSQDMMSYHDFSKTYCKIFGDSGDLVTRGKWSFPVSQTATAVDIKDHLKFKLDISNIEGYLNVQMPTIEESLAYTYKRFCGAKIDKKSSSGEGIQYI